MILSAPNVFNLLKRQNCSQKIIQTFCLQGIKAITVALDRDMYTDKITKMLQDKDTYSVINRNLIKKINVKLRDLLKKWKESDYGYV